MKQPININTLLCMPTLAYESFEYKNKRHISLNTALVYKDIYFYPSIIMNKQNSIQDLQTHDDYFGILK